uniref:Longin domain-containing protein n=1 Tax=Mycena chlorophos TaxID=658473 RepID=A0ABQ0LI73_MYCCL|nr:predicted protein [Mycena chlorophos]
MSLIHGLVARGSTILAEHQAGKRNFSQATEKILSKIPPNDSKLTYVWEEFLFHYISESGYTYLVMADDSAGRRMPFAFLADLQRKAHADTAASRRGARSVRRQQWWNNSKITALCFLVGLVFLWILVAQFCGAELNQCSSKSAAPDS